MRLIDADKLTEMCNIMAEKYDGIGEGVWHQFRTIVEWSPIVDAVPVVRCKDCPNWQADWEPRSYPSGHYCAMIDKFTDGEWFCATSIQEDN